MPDNEELFKTKTFGGYDKDDVQQELQKLKDTAYVEKSRLQKELADAQTKLEEAQAAAAAKDEKISELQETLAVKDREILEMEKNIKEKYQSYVDNYETIGSLIYESRIRAKKMDQEAEEAKAHILEEAEAEADKIRANAEAEANKKLEDIQHQIEEKNFEGKLKYNAVQEELNHVVEMFSQVQRQFMTSYKSIQSIVSEQSSNAAFPDSDEEEDDE